MLPKLIVSTPRALAIFSVAWLASACADGASPEAPVTGIDPGSSTLDGEVGDPGAEESFTYVEIEPDSRECATPLCGGYFVTRVNRAHTFCADGTVAERCYVADLDWSRTSLSADRIASLEADAHRLLLRGEIEARTYDDVGQVGILVVTEAWVAGTDAAPEGTLARIEDLGVRCFAAPCESMLEIKLNSVRSELIADVDWSNMPVAEDVVARAMQAIYEGGLIVAGWRTEVTGPAGTADGRAVTQFWTRAADLTPSGCFVGGCSQEICSEDPGAVSTCEWRPEYACYRSAECARQDDGACGWTPTDALAACLADPPTP